MKKPARGTTQRKGLTLIDKAEARAHERVYACTLRELLRGESGQVLPWIAIATLMVLSMSALVVDIGHAMVVQRQLQNSVDAAALAAAETLPNTTYSTVGEKYSAGTGGDNDYSGITISNGTATITPLCLTTVEGWGISCTSSSPNAIQVTESAKVSTFFANIFGVKNLTVSATSTASKGRPEPYNVAVILDTTPSMSDYDSSCSETQLACAVTGVQQLLKGLEPSMDYVSLFTFPNRYVDDVANDYSCNGQYNESVPPYTFPYTDATSLATMPYTYTTTTSNGSHGSGNGGYGNGGGYGYGGGYGNGGGGTTTTTTTVQVTYQVVGYVNDYRSSNTSNSLNSSSDLVKAVGGASGCASMGTGYENTYYAGAIYAAQASLVAEQEANPNSLNAMILLSDGNATAREENPGGDFEAGYDDMVTGSQSTNVATDSGSYGSWVGQCSQGVDAAEAASNAGTTIYTIAYGSPSTSSSANCGSDRSYNASHPDITPCQALQDISTNYTKGDTSHFYSDYNFGGDTGCQASGANSGTTAISDIYKAIASDLSGARLIPNSTP